MEKLTLDIQNRPILFKACLEPLKSNIPYITDQKKIVNFKMIVGDD